MSKKKEPRFRHDPKKYPKVFQEAISIDYANKLTSEQKTWLAAFNEAEYGANPEAETWITKKPVSQSDKRSVWKNTKRKQRDALANTAPKKKETPWDEDRTIPLQNAFSGNIEDLYSESPEDALIAAIDLKNSIKKKK